MTSPFADDATLVAALRTGDEAAFCWLLDTHSARLHRLARTFVRTPSAAEEVVQETWMAVIDGIARFEGRSSVRTWIQRILVNQARRRGAREARAVPFSALAADDGAVVDPDAFLPAGDEWAGHWASSPWTWEHLPPERLEAAETLDVVCRAIEQLAPVARQVIVLRDVEGWSAGDVSELLDLTEGNQRVVLHRARGRVRRALEAHLAATEP